MVVEDQCMDENDAECDGLFKIKIQQFEGSTDDESQVVKFSDTMAPTINNHSATHPTTKEESSSRLIPSIENQRQNAQPFSRTSSNSESSKKPIEHTQHLVCSTPSSTTAQNGNTLSKNQDDTADQMLIPSCFRSDSDICDLLIGDMKLPPVTTSTLNELDLQWIQNNIHLRIDVNYDHDLHFMPISGGRGMKKREYAKRYWLSLAAELKIYAHDRVGHCHTCESLTGLPALRFDQRLPTMFHELRDLLENLVPDRDRDQIIYNMDVELLMQQLKKGVLDVVPLCDWLASLLMNHCAPMRDQWAGEIAQQIGEGSRQGDMVSLVAGLEKLFSFLEAMKLDIANHLIRTFRFPLIEDTVAFQQDYFRIRIDNNKIDVARSRSWFEDVVSQHTEICMSQGKEQGLPAFSPLVHGLVEYCVMQTRSAPPTLKYDLGRLHQHREEIQDILYVDICLDVFDRLARRNFGSNCELSRMQSILQTRLLDLTDNASEKHSCIADVWFANVEAVAMEITRAASSIRSDKVSNISDDEFDRTARWLRQKFTNERTTHNLARGLVEKLERKTNDHAAKFQQISSVAISETQKHWHQSVQRTTTLRYVPDLEDIARRLAHITVIHWRVWACLAYLDPIDTNDHTDEVMSSSLQVDTATASEVIEIN